MPVAFFTGNKHEADLIHSIARKASALALHHNIDYPILDATMDITACHVNGMPLELEKLKAAPTLDFMHDVFGIRKNINRITGTIENCFVPRCAQAEKAKRKKLKG